MKRRRVRFHLVAGATHDRGLVTLGAGGAVEQRPEAGGGREHPQEDAAATIECESLLEGQKRQRRADRSLGREIGAQRARTGRVARCRPRERPVGLAGDDRGEQGGEHR